MKLLLLRAAAVEDIRTACEHYRRARPGLDEEMVEDLGRLFARLEAFPRSAPIVAGVESVRRAPLRRFPFAVFYRVTEPERIDILRVIHTARSSEERPR